MFKREHQNKVLTKYSLNVKSAY